MQAEETRHHAKLLRPEARRGVGMRLRTPRIAMGGSEDWLRIVWIFSGVMLLLLPAALVVWGMFISGLLFTETISFAPRQSSRSSFNVLLFFHCASLGNALVALLTWLFYFLGSMRKWVQQYHPHDRYYRLRPMLVTAAALYGCGRFTIAFALDQGSSGRRTVQLIPEANAFHILIFILSLSHLYSFTYRAERLKAFQKIKRYAEPSSSAGKGCRRLCCTKLRVGSMTKCWTTRCKRCYKVAYRNDTSGHGRDHLLRDVQRERLCISNIIRDASWKEDVRKVAEYKRHRRRMRKFERAYQHMLVQFAYGSMKSIMRDDGSDMMSPIEACIGSVYLVSSAKLDALELINDRAEEVLDILRQLNAQWKAIMLQVSRSTADKEKGRSKSALLALGNFLHGTATERARERRKLKSSTDTLLRKRYSFASLHGLDLDFQYGAKEWAELLEILAELHVEKQSLNFRMVGKYGRSGTATKRAADANARKTGRK